MDSTKQISISYIIPRVQFFPTLERAKESYSSSWFKDESVDIFEELFSRKRTVIVGEPGIGKTELMERLASKWKERGGRTLLIPLRDPEITKTLESIRGGKIRYEAILLDGMDEISLEKLQTVVMQIQEVARKNEECNLYLSSRWSFVLEHPEFFSGYSFGLIRRFSYQQIEEFLGQSNGLSARDVRALWKGAMISGHGKMVIEIPRYLAYLARFIQDKGIKKAAEISRNDLFEYFIETTLKNEDKKTEDVHYPLKVRILEKLALVMEIHQTNSISYDDFITFFDNVRSDLKLSALSMVTLGGFFKKSLLDCDGEGTGKIEFENPEFQEYLAAKATTRFSDIQRALFSFMIEPNLRILYPSWTNTLAFLVDMRPELLEAVIEFFAIKGEGHTPPDEALAGFMSKINPRVVPEHRREELFENLITYYSTRLQWMPGELGYLIGSLFSPGCEEFLRKALQESERKIGDQHFVPLTNVVHAVGSILEGGGEIDRKFWKDKLVALASDSNENEVVRRHALSALENLNDQDVVDKLPRSVMEEGGLVAERFVELCTTIAPNHPKSISYLVEDIGRNNWRSRYALGEIVDPTALKALLKAFNQDERFRDELLDHSWTFERHEKKLIEHLEKVWDKEIGILCKEAILKTVEPVLSHKSQKSELVLGIWKLCKKKLPNFIPNILKVLHKSEGKSDLYFAQRLLKHVMTEKDLPLYAENMIEFGEKDMAFRLIKEMESTGSWKGSVISKLIKTKFSKEESSYKRLASRSKESSENIADQKLLKDFRILLQPSPGQFSGNVFETYGHSFSRLDPLLKKKDKERMLYILKGTVFGVYEPKNWSFKVTKQEGNSKTYTTSQGVKIFGDALMVADKLGFDLEPYRSKLIHYIPFAYNEHLAVIFKEITNVRPDEIQPVLEIYGKQESDLWLHQPGNFIEAAEKYDLRGAVGVLKSFIQEPRLYVHERVEALRVVMKLSPAREIERNVRFLEEIFEKYIKSQDAASKEIALKANELLIQMYQNKTAFDWRMEELIKRAGPVKRREGVYTPSKLENEMDNKTFSAVLEGLDRADFQEDYLRLVEQAVDINERQEDFLSYGGYIWKIVYAYFDNLKKYGSYEPLSRLGEKLLALQGKRGANWFLNELTRLRGSYMGHLGKPGDWPGSIQKYNAALEFSEHKILNSDDLVRHTLDCIEKEIKSWVEDEGGYAVILDKTGEKTKRNHYERIVQRSLKSEIRFQLQKRGFQCEVIRESELHDGKKVDFTIFSGFVGPVVLEVKLASNSQIRGTEATLKKSKSYTNMKQYMAGYNASRGIFLIINDQEKSKLEPVTKLMKDIPGVEVCILKCSGDSPIKKKAKRGSSQKNNKNNHKRERKNNKRSFKKPAGRTSPGNRE